MASKDDFIDKCIRMCSMSNEDIIKQILHESLNNILSGKTDENEEKFPVDCDIMTYIPTRKTFPDFAINLCKSELNRESFLRNVMHNDFDKVVNENKRTSDIISDGRRTRSRRSNPRRNNTLPGILSVFTSRNRRGDFEILDNIESIIKCFFVDHVRLSENIYSDESNNYVIVVYDSIDSKWKSKGNCNVLSWKLLPSEYSKDVFLKITDKLSTVHVIRKRLEEFRYMGKIESIDEVIESDNTCVMTVC